MGEWREEGAGNGTLGDAPLPKFSMENLGCRIVPHIWLRPLLRNQRSNSAHNMQGHSCLTWVKIDNLLLKPFKRCAPDGLKPQM